GRLDEFAFAGGEDLHADKAGVANPSTEREGENEIENARAAEGDEGDGEKNSGEREECIHHHDIDEAVDGSAVVTGDGADDKAEDKRGEHHRTANQHRDARAVDDTREDVATEFVGAKPMIVRGKAKANWQVNRGGGVRGAPGCEAGDDE